MSTRTFALMLKVNNYRCKNQTINLDRFWHGIFSKKYWYTLYTLHFSHQLADQKHFHLIDRLSRCFPKIWPTCNVNIAHISQQNKMSIQSDYQANVHISGLTWTHLHFILHSTVFCLEIYFSHTEKKVIKS